MSEDAGSCAGRRGDGGRVIAIDVATRQVTVLAEKYNGKAKVVKLNVDENMITSGKYNIKGIPTLLLFKNGVIKEQIVGNTSKDTISKMIENHL